nr:hypothetical protein [Bacteroides fluxus]
MNDEHRLVYRIKEDVVVVLVLSVYGHYKWRVEGSRIAAFPFIHISVIIQACL